MKRMIDNKDYEALKNNVNDIKEDIDEIEEALENVKGIPSITIEVSQMLSETQVQLTEEQYNILDDNSIVNINLPTGSSIIFNKLYTNEVMLQYSSGLGTDIDTSVPYYFLVDVVKSTMRATLITLSLQKKLYQHNIILTDASNIASVGVTITNASLSPMDINDIKTWLKDKGFDDTSKLYPNISGFAYDTNAIYPCIKGIHINTDDEIRLIYRQAVNAINGLTLSNISQTDKIIVLNV